MSDVVVTKVSLWRETWKEIKGSRTAWQTGFIGFCLVIAVAHFAFAVQPPVNGILLQVQNNPQLLKQHPELMRSYMSAVFQVAAAGSIVLFAMLAVQIVGFYYFSVTYLRYAIKNSPPTYSVGGFFQWFGKAAWKYIRPLLWVLIPFIGIFFYLRSLIRYMAVSPMAVLGRKPELQRSWDLTKDNWWRIFGNQLLLALLLGLCVGIALVIIVAGSAIASHGDKNAVLYRMVVSLALGIWMGFGVIMNSIYCCTVYRVLLQERKPAAPAAPSVSN